MEITMDDKKTYELFEGKTLSNLFEDIYTNSKATESQVDTLIDQLRKFVTNLDHALAVVPLIREYLDVKVKNAEHLVKLSDTIQRMLRTEKSSGEDGLIISEEEKKQLLDEVPTYEQIRIKEQHRIKTLNDQVGKVTSDMITNINKEESVDGT